jgi:hypothetical protein
MYTAQVHAQYLAQQQAQAHAQHLAQQQAWAAAQQHNLRQQLSVVYDPRLFYTDQYFQQEGDFSRSEERSRHPHRGGDSGRGRAQRGRAKRCSRSNEVSHEVRAGADLDSLTAESLRGNVSAWSSNLRGRRVLQLKLNSLVAGNDLHAMVWQTIVDEITPIMVRVLKCNCGNYVFQAMLTSAYATDEWRDSVLRALTPRTIAHSACTLYGTRSIQMLVKTCTLPAQMEKLSIALASNVKKLSSSVNGNHVVQKMLVHFDAESKRRIVYAIIADSPTIALERHGCAVVQRCYDAATLAQRLQLEEMVRSISRSAGDDRESRARRQLSLAVTRPL